AFCYFKGASMYVRFITIVALTLPFRVFAWEDDKVLSFISRSNPVLQAQHDVSRAFEKPDSVTWALQNTSLSGRLGYGGTDFRNEPITAYGGLQINIPLSSIKEEREQALKLVAEAKETDDLHTKVITDIAQLRSLESEIEASDVKRKFLKEKAAWLKQRIEKGYSSEMDQLWTIGDKLNSEDATVAKVSLQAKTQRYKLARYAGNDWEVLLAYLEGKTQKLGGLDG
ncbi:MAG: hypothetical protein RLZ92_2126, partial [Pseudomonadota bacterium]